jgi:hypothetical protein
LGAFQIDNNVADTMWDQRIEYRKHLLTSTHDFVNHDSKD